MVTEADRLTWALFELSRTQETFSTQDVVRAIDKEFNRLRDEDAVSERLKNLREIGLLASSGGNGWTYKEYTLKHKYRLADE